MQTPHEVQRLVTELEQCKQDLLAANERTALARKETDRVRHQSNDIRTEHARLLGDETQRRVGAETQLTQARAEVERERRMRRDAEAAANDAAQEQRRHVEFVQDARKQFETRLTQLVTQLRQREEQVHNLEYQVRDRDRERQRADALEKIVATREASLAQLSGDLISIRKEHMELSAQAAAQAVQLKHAVQAAESAAERAAAAEAANNNNNSPRNNHHGSSSPTNRDGSPPPPPEEDPHVQETARLVAYSRDWIKETGKDFAALLAECDHMVTLVEDTGNILEKGNAGAGLDLANTDRRRQQKIRELEHLHMSDQMMKLESLLPSTTVVRNGLGDIKFQVSKVGATLQGAIDAVRSIRNLADKYCSQSGIPMLQQKLDRVLASQQQAPPPLPTPQYVPNHNQRFPNNHQKQQQNRSGSGTNTPTDGGGAGGPDHNNSGAATNPATPTGAGEASSSSSPSQLHPQTLLQQQSLMTPNSAAGGPVVALDEYITIQRKMAQIEVNASQEKSKLESEVMQLQVQVERERNNVVTEVSKATFDAERKFSEERRDLQRKIDEAEMNLRAMQRQHEDELRRQEIEGKRAVEKTRNELLEETRVIRDQCKSLERSENEAAEMMLQLQEQLGDSKNRRKELAQECSRLQDELKKEAQVAASLTLELQTARDAIVELSEEIDRLKEAQQHGGGAAGGGGIGGDDTSGLGGFAGMSMTAAAASSSSSHPNRNNNNNNVPNNYTSHPRATNSAASSSSRRATAGNNNNTSSNNINEDNERSLWAEWKRNTAAAGGGGGGLTNAATSGVLGRIAASASSSSGGRTATARPATASSTTGANRTSSLSRRNSGSGATFQRVQEL